VVIDHSTDGGYYLIGSRPGGFCGKISHNAYWGSGSVYKRATAWLEKDLIRFGVLPHLHDVYDLLALRVSLRSNKANK